VPCPGWSRRRPRPPRTGELPVAVRRRQRRRHAIRQRSRRPGKRADGRPARRHRKDLLPRCQRAPVRAVGPSRALTSDEHHAARARPNPPGSQPRRRRTRSCGPRRPNSSGLPQAVAPILLQIFTSQATTARPAHPAQELQICAPRLMRGAPTPRRQNGGVACFDLWDPSLPSVVGSSLSSWRGQAGDWPGAAGLAGAGVRDRKSAT